MARGESAAIAVTWLLIVLINLGYAVYFFFYWNPLRDLMNADSVGSALWIMLEISGVGLGVEIASYVVAMGIGLLATCWMRD